MPRQSKPQRDTVRRVMHEWKEGDLETSRGTPVRSQKQAVAIALHEAGASRDESPQRNRRNLAHTKARERSGQVSAEAGRSGGARRGRSTGGQGSGTTKAELMEEARRRDIPGRSRMSKAELQRALSRR